ncbi:MAG: hypothetical protein LBB10_03870, partial [Bifidobacteriaceae bacterium]|nr:hypothetical protein [Bifidobacteriaceae bacterium]
MLKNSDKNKNVNKKKTAKQKRKAKSDDILKNLPKGVKVVKIPGSPFLWLLVLLVIVFSTYYAMTADRTKQIDTSDGVALLQGTTVKKAEITEG